MTHNGFRVFDCDLHVMEPADLWLNYIAPKYRDQAPVDSQDFFNDQYLRHDGRLISRQQDIAFREQFIWDSLEENDQTETFRDYETRGWRPDVYLEAMETEGIDQGVLFPSRGACAVGKEYDDDRLAAAIARAYNDWLVEFCAADRDRLYGVGLVAPQCVASAIEEARRMKRELGFAGLYLRPNPVRGRNWHDPAYDPLWAVCEELGLPVAFHEGWPSELPVAIGERFDGRHEVLWLAAHTACHPAEMMYASLCLIVGGVLARFPGLKVGFFEANCSWVPYWLWRMDEHYEFRRRHVIDRIPELPSFYFKRQCWVAIEAEETIGAHMLDTVDDDNVLFSTDFPHEDSRYPNGVETFLSQPFPEASKRKILWDNCARFYGMG